MQKNINGLVLAGGKSTRMGRDKGAIHYHGKAHREYLADILQPFCEEVFISCRPEQNIQSDYPLLFDNYTNQGPIAALLTAFELNSKTTWLVVACDMPMITSETIQFLILNRNKNAIASVFQHSETQQIEPLIAIWEAKSYPIIQSYFERKIKSPMKILKENNVELLEAAKIEWLLNINSEKDKLEFLGDF